MVACMKEQMTEKKKLEDVTEVQMKYQKRDRGDCPRNVIPEGDA